MTKRPSARSVKEKASGAAGSAAVDICTPFRRFRALAGGTQLQRGPPAAPAPYYPAKYHRGHTARRPRVTILRQLSREQGISTTSLSNMKVKPPEAKFGTS